MRKKPPTSYLIMAVISVVLGIVVYSGFILKDDPNGRLMVGSVWLIVAVIWVARYFQAKSRISRRRTRDE